MDFQILGALTVSSSGQQAPIGGARERKVLALLLVDANRVVPVERLVDALWEEPPATARQQVHQVVYRLRRALSTALAGEKQQLGADSTPVIAQRSGGYALEVDPDGVDLYRFRRLVARTGTDTERAAWLRQALDLWQGEPLADLSGDWVDRMRRSWQREYLDAVVEWAGAAWHAGDPAAALGTLTELVELHPLDEPLAAALMRALYATGRGTHALDVYLRVRRQLVEELGVDPGTDLQALHQTILRGEPLPGPPADQPRVPQTPVPAQLPSDVPTFTGRTRYLAELNTMLSGEGRGHQATVIAAIDGTAGVGKTILAVHWAHQVRDNFPDGQLYVNLRGFDLHGQVVDPDVAVRRFLDALDVSPQRIPADPDAQVALYRSLLADKRMLIVLDNARDSAQVRPLLPGASGCLVVVTSRNQLSGLVATHGAQPLTLDLLTDREARELLTHRLGADRLAAEPDATAEIIIRCAGLPLALTMVAAHANLNPHASLRVLADQLRDARQRWDILTGDDPSTDVQAVFSWSYRSLSPPAARLFRLLGLHPGPDIGTPVAASLTALPVDQATPLLAELTRANLITHPAAGRHALHDLLRAYATHLAHTNDSEDQRREATHRLLDHYLHTAYAAGQLLLPNQDSLTLAPPRPAVAAEQPAGHEQAMNWFITEYPALVAAIEHAAATGFDTHTWQLAWTLRAFLDYRGHWHDGLAAGNTAVVAAQRLADPAACARAHRILARAYMRLGRFNDAHEQLSRALDLDPGASDQIGHALTHQGLASVWARRGNPVRALAHARQSLDLFRAVGNRAGEACGLNSVGWCNALLGNHQRAIACCREALALLQELDDRDGQASTWDSLGYAYHHLGQRRQAVTCYQNAIDLHHGLGDRYDEAVTLARLGDTHHGAGDLPAARDAYRQALAIFETLDHPDAVSVRTKSDSLALP